VDEQDLRRRLTALRRRAAERPTAVRPGEVVTEREKTAPIGPWERAVLELIVSHPEIIESARGRIGADCFTSETSRRLFETCARLADEGILPVFDRLMLEFDDPAMQSFLVGLDEHAQDTGQTSANPETLLNGLVLTMSRKDIEKQRPAELVALREGGLDVQQQSAMLEDIIRRKRDLS